MTSSFFSLLRMQSSNKTELDNVKESRGCVLNEPGTGLMIISCLLSVEGQVTLVGLAQS